MTQTQLPTDARDMQIIDEYLEHLRRKECTEKTIGGRRGILTRLNQDMPHGLGQVSRDELERWLHRDDWSQNTKATYWRAIHSFYGWAVDPDDPWLTADPTAKMEPVVTADGIARPCTDEELRRVLAEAAQPFRLWALIAAYQGLRCCEISGLDREHVTERQLIVVKGKGGRPRIHDTDPGVWRAVKDLPNGPVARRPDNGERASAHYVGVSSQLHFLRHLKINTSMHRFRHWLGVTLQEKYRDIRVTQEALGHRSVTSTQIYTRATAEQLRAARAMLPRLDGDPAGPSGG